MGHTPIAMMIHVATIVLEQMDTIVWSCIKLYGYRVFLKGAKYFYKCLETQNV